MKCYIGLLQQGKEYTVYLNVEDLGVQGQFVPPYFLVWLHSGDYIVCSDAGIFVQ